MIQVIETDLQYINDLHYIDALNRAGRELYTKHRGTVRFNALNKLKAAQTRPSEGNDY